MANKLFQAFIDTAKTIAGYPITVANAVFMRDGSTLDEFSENIPHREDNEDTNIEVPNIDADMLNGHPASYYAKQSDLSALNNSVTQVNNKIGNTDVSKWGNSLTGAIKAACDKADANEAAIADVNSNLNKMFITKTFYPIVGVINSNAGKSITFDVGVEGYTPISFKVISYASGMSNCSICFYSIIDNNASLIFRNNSSSPTTDGATAYCTVNYIKI